MASTARSIVVCRLSSLGDVILATTVLSPLREKYPQADIHVVSDDAFADVFKDHPANISFFGYRRDMKSWELEDIRRAIIRASDNREPDLVIDLQNNRRSAKLLLSFKKKPRTLKKYHLKKFIDVHTSFDACKNLPHVVERYAAVAGVHPDRVALPNSTPEVTLNIPESQHVIGLCLGAGHYTKRWPFSSFLELADELTSRGKYVVLLGGRAEQTDSDRLRERAQQPEFIINGTQLDLLRSFSVVRQCDHIVCNDSAIAHMASAYNVPTSVLFGSTVPRFGFTPWNSEFSVIETSNLPCRPCTHYGRARCPKEHFRCMREITVDQVVQSVLQP